MAREQVAVHQLIAAIGNRIQGADQPPYPIIDGQGSPSMLRSAFAAFGPSSIRTNAHYVTKDSSGRTVSGFKQEQNPIFIDIPTNGETNVVYGKHGTKENPLDFCVIIQHDKKTNTLCVTVQQISPAVKAQKSMFFTRAGKSEQVLAEIHAEMISPADFRASHNVFTPTGDPNAQYRVTESTAKPSELVIPEIKANETDRKWEMTWQRDRPAAALPDSPRAGDFFAPGRIPSPGTSFDAKFMSLDGTTCDCSKREHAVKDDDLVSTAGSLASTINLGGSFSSEPDTTVSQETLLDNDKSKVKSADKKR